MLLQNKGSLKDINPFDTDAEDSLSFGYEDMLAISGTTAIDGCENETHSGQTKNTSLRRKNRIDTDNNLSDTEVIDFTTADLSMYAPMSKADYMVKQITYVLENGSNGEHNPDTFKKGDKIVLEPATKDYYTFDGWYLSSSFVGDPITVLDDSIRGDVRLYAKWNYDALSLPIVSITLDNNFPLEDVTKEEYISGKFSITNTDEEYEMNNVGVEFKGRGNTSWIYNAKKSFKLKFNSKQSIFGEAKSKHWVLYAERSSHFMRNALAYIIGNEILDGIEHSSSHHLVDLYINNSYHGTYSVFESIRLEESRINIDSEYAVLDTGYLFELDVNYGGKRGIDFFGITGPDDIKIQKQFTMHSPDPKNYQKNGCTEKQFRMQIIFIEKYVQKVYNAVFNEDLNAFFELVDMDSMVDMYILQEYFKNADAGMSSFYMYKKPGGKLYFGSPWDLEFIQEYSENSKHEGICVGADIINKENWASNAIYIYFMRNNEFVKLVKNRWKQVSDAVKDLVESKITSVKAFNNSFKRDSEKWGWVTDLLTGSLDPLKTWLLARADWLDGWAAT